MSQTLQPQKKTQPKIMFLSQGRTKKTVIYNYDTHNIQFIFIETTNKK